MPASPPQRIGVVAESTSGETRVAATPDTVRRLIELGYEIVVETGAGAASGFSDVSYVEAGARLDDAWPADVVLKVNAPSHDEVRRLRDGATIVGLLAPAQHSELLTQLANRPLTALSMDAVPRISRAQSLDVLSSMANIAGYRAVIEAAHAFGRFFTGQVTAAGKVPPAKVLVVGAGVAGLAAIGAAGSLGAVVRATDPRSEVADQVRSLGGEFLPVEVEQESAGDGYARATSEAYDRRAAEIYSEQARDVDIIITTALIPGRPAPRLITAVQVASMKPGSVIVDMAAAQGGNVEGTVSGRAIVTENGVTVIGYTDLAGRLPAQASQLYGTNLVNLLKLLTPERDGQLTLDLEDVVQRAVTVVHDGETLWPPPPVAVSAAPAKAPAAPASPVDPTPPRRLSPAGRYGLIALGMLALFAIVAVSPAQLASNFTVFALAVVIGYYVIGKVHHALHTPLMSVTNAISGIVVVGALLQIGHPPLAISVLAFLAILLTTVNIFGGFAVTRRMLGMFSKG
ncbi:MULTISPECIES: Re/Si-specific NAD(P)(+) transhydrogenase subunit alpha [unclassified Streptomyces]|jgi:NAD(P) transhydrogenase subunit alpha|uniref:NAD(P) transhydrogenase subunit alpha n=1 Tax=Streptomyces sp. NBC_00119 TaxID=2975659 RepID=A0AAU1U4P5_9ACTN|nr:MULTISPECIES: Re/Si-specific NAD(P)(+) transhydrogenase subunit alpha [unclassified Streptomyces]MCX4641700.1 Re/Si-specific NAD(P)(+) transhydrogenase subunit alpha [Streptomyces sp. NBC_01446]MCX5321887.1 Re/Si-specific NAD(P)(+) transhydrogenase subunit alpha [Streptomyces sp. NBC_00120]